MFVKHPASRRNLSQGDRLKTFADEREQSHLPPQCDWWGFECNMWSRTGDGSSRFVAMLHRHVLAATQCALQTSISSKMTDLLQCDRWAPKCPGKVRKSFNPFIRRHAIPMHGLEWGHCSHPGKETKRPFSQSVQIGQEMHSVHTGKKQQRQGCKMS